MKLSVETREQCLNMIGEMRLPDGFMRTVENIYAPLAAVIIESKGKQVPLVSINGAQGTGKSTMTTFVSYIIETEYGYRVAELSLDDFYLTRTERQQLASSVHPLFITRGVPGTHDLDLMESVITDLMNQRQCYMPRFDKAADDRKPRDTWTHYADPVDIILFEGWCNSSPSQDDSELVEPINDLERLEDAEGVWRSYANDKLKQYHKRIYDHADMCIMLKAPDFECIYEWRRLQEKKLQDKSAGVPNRIMNDEEIRRFIQHYERISRHTLKQLPASADILIPVNNDHTIERWKMRDD